MNQFSIIPPDENPPVIALGTFLMILLTAGVGALGAILILPAWMPGFNNSVQGTSPQVFWFLSRASALVAYLLLWLSMSLGLMITNKLARLWPGGPLAFDLHQFASLLGVAFSLFHGMILLGDQYIHTTFHHILLPFAVQEYKPFWVGLGQLGFYLMAGVALSFYVRKQLTQRVWRLIHFLSFASFLFALFHGILGGTDTRSVLVQWMYLGTGATFLFLLAYRVLARFGHKETRQVFSR